MSDTPQPNHFGEDQAAAYDSNFVRLAPLKEALHLCMRGVLGGCPPEASVLCVGAGTGAELLYLAEAFPGWRFTLVEPSAPMLQRCREKAEAAGIISRCTFHEGYLETLPISGPFDIATAILVSQFLLQAPARTAFFEEIAARLRPGGHLVTADLSCSSGSALFETWMHLMRYNGLDEQKLLKYREAVGQHVAISPPEEIRAFLSQAGFDTPECFFQTVLIHAWHTRRH